MFNVHIEIYLLLYKTQVRAADQVDSMGTVRSSFATVMVTIGDVNDNTPTFPGGK